MNRPPSNRPGSRRPPRANPTGLTAQQIMILALILVLGSAALALAGWVMFSPNASPNAAAVSTLAATITALPAASGAQPGEAASQAPNLPPSPEACLQGQKGYQQGTLLQVLDGSTLEMQIGNQGQRVTYAGIEVSQSSLLAQAAAQKAGELLAGQPVMLLQDTTAQDAAGRLPRYLVAGGKFINLELVRQGLARVQPGSPDQACAAAFQQAEAQAKADRLGQWKPTPVPTRTFMPFVTLDTSNQAPCDCSARPTCENFTTHAEAQACFNACNDYNSKLDDNHDGIACPELP